MDDKRTARIVNAFFDNYGESNVYPSMYDGCCEPGYDDKPVILANWNHVPAKWYDKLESLEISCEWYDEWIVCDECYKVFRSSPDSYGWEMYGIIKDGEAICGDCLKDEIGEYLESLENQPKRALTCSLLRLYDPTEYGYTLVQDEYENGLHEGMNDNPQEILKSLLKSDPSGKFIFAISDQSQFYITFAVYRRDTE